MRRAVVSMCLLLLVIVIAGPAIAESGGRGKGSGNKVEGHLVVPDTTYGSTVVAAANPGGDDVYVFTQCWLKDGTYVFAAFYSVVDGQAVIGPLRATTWSIAAAGCTAQEGYFTRNGWGKWVVLAADTFEVAEV